MWKRAITVGCVRLVAGCGQAPLKALHALPDTAPATPALSPDVDGPRLLSQRCQVCHTTERVFQRRDEIGRAHV